LAPFEVAADVVHLAAAVVGFEFEFALAAAQVFLDAFDVALGLVALEVVDDVGSSAEDGTGDAGLGVLEQDVALKGCECVFDFGETFAGVVAGAQGAEGLAAVVVEGEGGAAVGAEGEGGAGGIIVVEETEGRGVDVGATG